MNSSMPVGIEERHITGQRGWPAGLASLVLLGALILAAIAGWLGGMPSETARAANADVELSVTQPRILRSGMFFETVIELRARQPLEDATIAMAAPLWRSITINTAMPQASEEEFSNGDYRLHFGPLQAGESIVLKLDSQINPDLFAGTHGAVSANDGDRRLVTLPITKRVLP